MSLRVFSRTGFSSESVCVLAITTVATGLLEAGVPLFLDDALGLSSAAIGGVLLVMVLMQALGSVIWGRWVDRNGPTLHGHRLVFVVASLLGVGLVGSLLAGNVAVLGMILLLGSFQFFIAATQIPMLPMIDTAPTVPSVKATLVLPLVCLERRGQREPSSGRSWLGRV